MIRQAAEVDLYYLTWNLSVEPYSDGAHLIWKIARGVMKIVLFVVGGILIAFGLMILQLRSLKKYHPNAELLIGVCKRLNSSSAKK